MSLLLVSGTTCCSINFTYILNTDTAELLGLFGFTISGPRKSEDGNGIVGVWVVRGGDAHNLEMYSTPRLANWLGRWLGHEYPFC
jgi:hypothetical protein